MQTVTLRTTFFALASISEGYWPNIHKALKDKGLLDLVYETSEKVYDAHKDLIAEFRKLRNEALGHISDAIATTEEILQSQMLKGKCILA